MKSPPQIEKRGSLEVHEGAKWMRELKVMEGIYKKIQIN